MKNLIQKQLIISLALVGVLTVVGVAHSTERIVNGDFTANAALFVSGNGEIGKGSNPTNITGWTAVNDAGGPPGRDTNYLTGINGGATGLSPNKNPKGPANPGGRTYATVASYGWGEGQLRQNMTLQAGNYQIKGEVAATADLTEPATTAKIIVTDGTYDLVPYWAQSQNTRTNFASFKTVISIPWDGVWTIILQNSFSIGADDIDYANISLRDLPIIDPVAISGFAGTTLTYTGGAGTSFTLLTSTSATAPLDTWTVVATNPTTPGTFTIPAVGSGAGPVFYSIQSQ